MLMVSATLILHAGHGTQDPSGALHYFLEPMHATVMLAVGVTAAALTLVFRRRWVAAKVRS